MSKEIQVLGSGEEGFSHPVGWAGVKQAVYFIQENGDPQFGYVAKLPSGKFWIRTPSHKYNGHPTLKLIGPFETKKEAIAILHLHA